MLSIKSFRVALLGGLVLTAFGPMANANTTYETESSWDGGSAIAPWGNPNTSTYGQTFLAPAVDNILDDFTFHINAAEGVSIQYKAQVFAWSGSLLGGGGGGATGPALYSSASM